MNKSQYKSLSEWKKANPQDYQMAYKKGCIEDICDHFGWDRPKKVTDRKPNGYWDVKENVLAEALKYASIGKWSKGSSSSYHAAKKYGWYEEATAHMKQLHKPEGYWYIKENVLAEARKHNTLSEWRKHGGASPAYARKYGWYEEATAHMELVKTPNGYWNIKENVIADALTFDDLTEWRGKHRKAFESARDNGWLDECIAHMTLPTNKPTGYWTKKICLEEARKFTNRKDWRKHGGGSFNAAYKHGWMDECTAHMEKRITYWTKERCMGEAKKYTRGAEWRKKDNNSYSAAYRNGWIDECIAHMESDRVSSDYWTKERCHEEALKHNTKSSFKDSRPSTPYNKARKNGWLDEICSHMEETRKPAGYWHIKENVLEEARKHKTRSEWHKSSSISFSNSKKYGWYDECVAHMEEVDRHTPNHWTKERCLEEARKHKVKSHWIESAHSSYQAAKRYGWFDECTEHMEEADRFKPIYWTKERCLEEASKYSSRNEWFKSSGSSYQSAKKYTWFDECVAHMEDKYKPMGFWNDKENVLAEARKYKTKGEWVKNSAPSYQAANKHEWFDECVAHMVSTRKPDGYWHIKENVLAEARKHKTRGAWHKSSSISFTMSKKYGWYDECVAHMGEKLHKPEGYWNDKENVLAEARKYKTNQEWKEKGGASQNFAYKHGWFEECVAHMKKK